MSQIIINTGNIANDGTGDPLRTAFNDVNTNFTQIFNAGPVGSNIAIANNTIQVTNSNGNLRLATNGIGTIVPAANFVPDIPNARYIGTATNRFNTIYSQYLNATTGTFGGNVYVAGNLFVTGTTVTVDYANANIANLTLTLAGGSSNAALANGAGIKVASANANFVYNYSSNSWNSTIAITAPSFIGDGSQLTDVNAIVDANDLIGNTLSSTVVFSNLTSFGSVIGISATGDISTTGNVYANVITGNTITGTFIGDGSNLVSITANAIVGTVSLANIANSAYTANLAALATQAINADTALFAINANLAAFANVATSAQTSNTAQYSVQSDNANSAVVAGMAYQIAPTANISVVGNITTSGYFFGNGSQLTGIVAVADYSNANVAAYLPVYSGDILANDVTANGLYMGDVPPSTPGAYYFWANSSGVSLGETAAQSISVTASGINIGGTAGANIYGVNGANVNIGDSTGGYINIVNDVISTNSITATTYFGDGSNLTGIASNYGNANVADYLPTYTGDLSANNISIIGNITTSGPQGNITGAYLISADYLSGDGSNITNLPAGNYSNANVGAYLPTYTGNLVNLGGDVNTSGNVSASGNITAGGGAYFIGDGSLLTNLPAGNYSNANVAAYLPTYTGNLTADTISVTGNINGRLSNGNSSINIATSGNITLGIGPFNTTRLNVSAFGISVAGNVIGSYLYGDGSNITNLPAGNYGNSNVAAYLPTFTGNLAGNNVSITGNVYTDGKVLHLGETTANGVAANGAGIIVGDNVAEIVYDNSVFGWSVNQGWHPTANVAYNLGRSNRVWNNFYALNINGTDASFVNSISVTNSTTSNVFVLANAGTSTTSVIQKNQNPPYGGEQYGIELLTTTDDPNVFSSMSSGPDYVALLSTNAGNANVIVQGGYGVTISTSNATGADISEWSFVAGGDTFFPGNLSVVGNITGDYIYGNGYYLTGITGGATPSAIVNGTSNIAIATANGNAVVGFAGSDTFTFGTDGNLTFLYGSKIAEVASPVPGNYALALQGTGITDPDQQLLVYPTSLDANHLHLTSGNLYNTELFLGNDDLYVKLANTGDIYINANDGAGATAQWKFGADGNMLMPGNVSSAGNVVAPYFIGSGSQLTNLPAPTVTYDNTSNGDMDIMTYDGNIKYVSKATIEPSSGNIKSAGNISVIGNITGSHFNGNGSQLTGLFSTTNSIAIGANAGANAVNSIAIGQNAGDQGSQGANAVAIGAYAGSNTQGTYSIAIGRSAGYDTQGNTAIAIGRGAGNLFQGMDTIAIGGDAGNINQGLESIAIGHSAGSNTQSANSIAIGTYAGLESQQEFSIAIGTVSGTNNQGNQSIAIGHIAGHDNQGNNSIAIGTNAGNLNQGITSIAIGPLAGNTDQGNSSIAIGISSGNLTQADGAIAIGRWAGNSQQGGNAVAVGRNAGNISQGDRAVAVGQSAGSNIQGVGAVAIGWQSGSLGQAPYAVAIGAYAGNLNQGSNSVAIGAFAGYPVTANNAVVINGLPTALNAPESGFYIAPVRNDNANVTNAVYYNTSTNEVTYGPTSSGSNYGNSNVATFLADFGSNTISTSGNITTGTANLYAVNINQSITWPGLSEIYEDTNLVLQGNTGVGITSPGDTQITAGTYSWTLSVDGNLTTPQGGYIGPADVKGQGTMLSGGLGNITSVTSYYADAPGIYSSCLTANPDGTLNITTYGNGTGQNGQWTFSGANLTLPAGGNLVLASGSIVGDGASPAPSINGFDSVNAITLSASGNVYGTNIKAEAPFTIQSSNFNAIVGNRYGVNTASGPVVATLTAFPTTGAAVFFADAGGAFATNNLTINPVGQTIMGASGNMTVSTNNQSFGLFWNGTTWRTYNAG